MGWAAVDSQELRAGENALRAVPTNACFFNTSTNFSCVKMSGPGSAHYFSAPSSRVSLVFTDIIISVRGKFVFYQNLLGFWKHFRSGEQPDLDMSTPRKNCQVSKKNRWLFG
jgi:hypothetical protein